MSLNQTKSEIDKKTKSARLRAIDQGTRYDIIGNMRKFVRRLEQGELKNVKEVIVITRMISPPEGTRSFDVWSAGNGSVETAHWMMESAKRMLEG